MIGTDASDLQMRELGSNNNPHYTTATINNNNNNKDNNSTFFSGGTVYNTLTDLDDYTVDMDEQSIINNSAIQHQSSSSEYEDIDLRQPRAASGHGSSRSKGNNKGRARATEVVDDVLYEVPDRQSMGSGGGGGGGGFGFGTTNNYNSSSSGGGGGGGGAPMSSFSAGGSDAFPVEFQPRHVHFDDEKGSYDFLTAAAAAAAAGASDMPVYAQARKPRGNKNSSSSNNNSANNSISSNTNPFLDDIDDDMFNNTSDVTYATVRRVPAKIEEPVPAAGAGKLQQGDEEQEEDTSSSMYSRPTSSNLLRQPYPLPPRASSLGSDDYSSPVVFSPSE